MLEKPQTPSRPEAVAVAGSALILGLVLTITMMSLFAGIAFGWGAGWFETLDALVLDGAYWLRINNPWLVWPMRLITDIGYFWGFALQTLLVALILLWRRPQRWRSSLVVLGIAMIGTSVISPLLKNTWERPRPSLYEAPFSESSYSFPSGHSLSAAVFYGAVVLIACRSTNRRYLYWMIATLGATVAVWMGVSRLFFSVHYATDVLGGFASGLGWLTAVSLIDQLLRWWQGRHVYVFDQSSSHES